MVKNLLCDAGAIGSILGHVDWKDVQLESCKLSFIWGKMRTAAQEAVPQIALRDCSEEAVWEGRYNWFWWSWSSMQSSTYFIMFSASHEELMSPWRDLVLFQIWGNAKIGTMKSVPENIQLSKDLFHQFPWSTEWLFLHLEFPLGYVKRSAAAALQQMANALGKT